MRGVGGDCFVFGWGYFDGEGLLKRGLNDLDGCIGQPVIIIRGGFVGLKIDLGTRVVGVLGCFGFQKFDFF